MSVCGQNNGEISNCSRSQLPSESLSVDWTPVRSQFERKSGIGAVTLSAAGKREGEEGRPDSIKPELTGKLVGYWASSATSSGITLFSSQRQTTFYMI